MKPKFQTIFQSWKRRPRFFKNFVLFLYIKRHQKNTQAKVFEKLPYNNTLYWTQCNSRDTWRWSSSHSHWQPWFAQLAGFLKLFFSVKDNFHFPVTHPAPIKLSIQLDIQVTAWYFVFKAHGTVQNIPDIRQRFWWETWHFMLHWGYFT